MNNREEASNSQSMINMFEQQYLAAYNKEELDYWDALGNIIAESMDIRHQLGISQKDLAKKMKTTQSVISRFENMEGRKPGYDFIARLAIALGYSPGMTLQGDFMTVVPAEKQDFIKKLAQEKDMSTKKYLQTMFNEYISELENQMESIVQEIKKK